MLVPRNVRDEVGGVERDGEDSERLSSDWGYVGVAMRTRGEEDCL